MSSVCNVFPLQLVKKCLSLVLGYTLKQNLFQSGKEVFAIICKYCLEHFFFFTYQTSDFPDAICFLFQPACSLFSIGGPGRRGEETCLLHRIKAILDLYYNYHFSASKIAR